MEPRAAIVNYLESVSATTRLMLSAALGLVVGVVVSFFMLPQGAALVGWDVTAATFVSGVWLSIWDLDPATTQRRATRLDPSRSLADLFMISASVAILAAVALAIARAGHAHGGTKAYLLTVGLLSVVLSWLSVHTVFTLMYARLYYGGEPGGIDFNEPDRPDFHDFAYLAFTIGMTFQVSDTNLTAKAVRRAALRHALISYLYGAVILAVVINIVASLL